MEEKADRQDRIASALEDAQARLEEAEINVAAITVEMQSSAEELQASIFQRVHRSEHTPSDGLLMGS